MKKIIILHLLFFVFYARASQQEWFIGDPLIQQHSGNAMRYDFTADSSIEGFSYATYDEKLANAQYKYCYKTVEAGKWCENLLQLKLFLDNHASRIGTTSVEMNKGAQQAFYRLKQGVDFRVLQTINKIKRDQKVTCSDNVDRYCSLVNEIVFEAYRYCDGHGMRRLMDKVYPDFANRLKHCRNYNGETEIKIGTALVSGVKIIGRYFDPIIHRVTYTLAEIRGLCYKLWSSDDKDYCVSINDRHFIFNALKSHPDIGPDHDLCREFNRSLELYNKRIRDITEVE